MTNEDPTTAGPGASEYKCEACGLTFDKGWSEEEAVEERDSNFPDTPSEDMAIVCDDCFKRIMGPPEKPVRWAKTATFSWPSGLTCMVEIKDTSE